MNLRSFSSSPPRRNSVSVVGSYSQFDLFANGGDGRGSTPHATRSHDTGQQRVPINS